MLNTAGLDLSGRQNGLNVLIDLTAIGLDYTAPGGCCDSNLAIIVCGRIWATVRLPEEINKYHEQVKAADRISLIDPVVLLQDFVPPAEKERLEQKQK